MSGTLLPAGTTPGAPDDSRETSSCGQWAECLGLLTSCWGHWADWTCTEVTAFWIMLGLEGCQAFLSCRVLEYVFSFNKKSFFKKLNTWLWLLERCAWSFEVQGGWEAVRDVEFILSHLSWNNTVPGLLKLPYLQLYGFFTFWTMMEC